MYCDLMAYLRPKYSSVEFNGNVKMGNEVTEALRGLIKKNDDGKDKTNI